MRTKRLALSSAVAAIALTASLLLITALVSAQAASVIPPPPDRAGFDLPSSKMVKVPSQPVSVTFPGGPWPWYAQGEISVHPEPPRAGHPTELCAEVVNHDPANVHTATLEFGVANFGIGVPFMPVGAVDLEVPPDGHARGCVMWVPPEPGPWCIEALLTQAGAPEPKRSLRNIIVWEPMFPGQELETVFQVGPLDTEGTVTFTLDSPLPWGMFINPPDFFLPVSTTQVVTLTTQVPIDAMLGSREPMVDVEGFLNGESIGGFRKLDMPPVLLHQLRDPFYAESEISISPYPARVGEPTELCVELFNLSDLTQTVQVQFSWANFGIGLPFNPIAPSIEVEIPPHSHMPICIGWVPPFDGRFCIQVEMNILGNVPYHPQFSQRNIDVGEPLEPGVPHTLAFPVRNPLPDPVTITLGLVPHLHDWGLELSQDILPNMDQTAQRIISLTVTPPRNVPLPPDGTVIVDVEALVDGELLGGFRKIHSPPIVLHRFPEPSYAESEISIYPYPPMEGEPTEVCVELYNPTPWTQEVEVQFSWANFGIGIPFKPINGPRVVHVPPHSIIRECMHWIPPVSGHVCLQVELFMDDQAPQRSQRNIDVGEPLRPGVLHTLVFSVGNPFLGGPVDVELGLIPHLDGWEFGLEPNFVPDIGPGETRAVSLTVVPPPDRPLPPDGTPIVDVEGFIGGELIGGFRKIHRPGVPLHPFPDPPYAEREITVNPYPPEVGEPTEICVELYNPTPWPQDVEVQFSWANFGIGLLFRPINGLRTVHLPPHSTIRECIHWIPPVSGHVCLQVKLFMDGELPQRSQRNIDVYEPLLPGQPHTLFFPVGNPLGHAVDIKLGFIPHLDGWTFDLSPDSLPDVPSGGEPIIVSLTVTPPEGIPLPPDGTVVVDVEAYAEGKLIGGFRKIHRPRVPLHVFPDPPYAEREISVHPYPAQAGEPTEICVELRNPTPNPQDVMVRFSWANFGIGIPFTPINGPRPVHLPPHSVVNECMHWIPPTSGHMCLQVELFMEGEEPQRSQRNIDVNEPLMPGEPDTLHFPVVNPFDHAVDIELGLIPHLEGWEFELSPLFLPNVGEGQQRIVSLTVIPPEDVPLPPDGTVIVDIEAFAEGELIGGFRKIFRPQVPVHIPGDPVYAEREIFVHPYPPRAQEPTELSVEVRNPTDEWQTVKVLFSVAPFGIGLPFEPVNEPFTVTLPPGGMAHPGKMWLPPEGGLWCIQVEIFIPGHDKPFWSRLNLDVGEPLRPLTSHSRPFPVGNPFTEPVTITLGLVPHFPDWGLELSQDVLTNVLPSEIREVILTVTPPADLPADGDPIVDVEAFVDGELLGGFRKIFRPDVNLHRPKDPQYAESEIFIDPYPVFPGFPTMLGVEVFNPTDQDRFVTATFSVAPFGIGLAFAPVDDISIFVPRHGAARGHVIWEPPPELRGKVCVRVVLEMQGHDPVWSQRNIDVGEPLEPGVPHSLVFPVGGWPHTETVSITLGLVKHMELWSVSLTPTLLTNVQPGQQLTVTLTVTPPGPGTGDLIPLGSREPIVDVEAFVEGELLGGLRKLDDPRAPLGNPFEKGYAESEISIDPYPPKLGQDSRVSTLVYNTSPDTVTVALEFGWAKFGMGIPFSITGMSPYTRSVTLSPGLTTTASVTWTPVFSGHQCVRVLLSDPDGHYEPQESMRNVDVTEDPPCGQTQVFSFTVYNDSDQTQTVDLGLITFDVPASWSVTTIPSDTLVLGPFSGGVVRVEVHIPCPSTWQLSRATREIYAIQQQSGSVPTVDVEGYSEGKLVGGIELRFEGLETPEIEFDIYLPLVIKNYP